MKRLLKTNAVAFVVLLIIIAYFVAPYFISARFVVINKSSEPVHVAAYWRDQEKWLGLIQPASEYIFKVNDEAAMSFVAHFPNGRIVESKEIYFTSGIVVIVGVYQSEIRVHYDFEN